MLQRAVELGVNFFDTADSYGPHVAEELIADALYPYPGSGDRHQGRARAARARIGGSRTAGPSTSGRSWRTASSGSGLERIDLWQLHRIDPKVPAQEQFEAVREFQREGLIRHVGLSEVTVADIEQARKVVPIVSVQNLYNVTDRKWEDEVDYCEREGLAFIPWFPLSAGALEAAALHQVAERHGATVYQIALAWLLARSPAMLVIPGTSSVEHLEENVAAAEIRLSRRRI